MNEYNLFLSKKNYNYLMIFHIIIIDELINNINKISFKKTILMK